MQNNLSKEEKQWNKQLTHHLDRYSYLRDWSELALWLTKLKNTLQDYKGHINDINLVLKKLAICLTVSSLPIALHESCLQIYQILFPHFITVSFLQLAFLGLFTFFGSTNTKNKLKIIEILIKFLPKFGNQLKMLATGIIITILPAFVEINDVLIKQINCLMDLLSKSQLLGTQILVQSIWIAVMRSSTCRIAGLKYLFSKMNIGLTHLDSNQEEDSFWDSNTKEKIQSEIVNGEPQQTINQNEFATKSLILQYCPHTQTVVLNSLVACLQDANILVVKSTLDFLSKYFPVFTEMISKEAKMKIAKTILRLLSRRDMSVTRKTNMWLFGKPDSDNKYKITSNNLVFVIEPLKEYLSNDNSVQPLKIILHFYSEHQYLPDCVLNQISKEIVLHCSQNQENQEILKLMHRFIRSVDTHTKIITESLGNFLLSQVEKDNFKEAARLLQLIIYFLHKILKPQNLKPIIKNTVKNIIQSYEQTQWVDHQYTKLALRQTILLLQQNNTIFRETTQSYKSQQVLLRHIELYGNLLEKLKQQQSDFHQEITLLLRMQVQIYEIFGIFSPKFVDLLISNIFLPHPSHYMPAIQVIGQYLQKTGIFKNCLFAKVEDCSNNYIEASIDKLWGILSLGHMQAQIVPLLLRYARHFPHFFRQILKRQFKYNNQLAITKFTLFWSLSPKYVQIATREQLEEICKPGLIQMLDYLDNGNPLIKYNTNLWINQCFANFHRVLNPLLQIMLKPRNFWYQTFQGQFIYVITPQTEQLTKTLQYLNSIIKHTKTKFFKFAKRSLSEHIKLYYEVFIGKELNNQIDYITSILSIITRIILSKYVNSHNPGIDLIACEVLETCFRTIDTPQMYNYVLGKNMKEILMALHFAIINEEYLLQIQLLNLLKIIFIDSNRYHKQEISCLRDIISHNLFINVLLEGLDAVFPYIKERFVQFISSSIVLLLEYHSNCAEIISRILNTYTFKIELLNNKKAFIKETKGLKVVQINTSILILFNGVKQLLGFFLNLEIKPFEKQKSQNDSDLGVFSLYSWKSFVSLKIQPRPIHSMRAKKLCDDISKQISNELEQVILTMTSCWTISQLLSYYKLSCEGISLFNYEEFHAFNKQLSLTSGRFETDETIENFIVNLIRVLINKYPKEVMTVILNNWSSAHTVEIRLKIVEIINLSSIPLEDFYNILTDSLNPDKISYKRTKHKYLDLAMSNQQQILHFCQVFTHYNFQNLNNFQTHNLLLLWSAFCRFLRVFQNSKNILTLYGLMELVDLFMCKNNPKQILKDEKLKKQFWFIITLMNDLVMMCAGKIKIISPSVPKLTFEYFFPLPTSVFELYITQACKKQQAKLPYFNFQIVQTLKGVQYCRIYGFFVIKRIIYSIFQAYFTDNQISLVKKIRQVMSYFLAIIEDKSQDHVLIECASEVILSILEKRHMFSKEFKQQILQIFNKDDFFICSSNTLHSWVQIIDMIIDNNKDHDMFMEYLDKVSLVSSIFSSYNLQTKKKIKSFERICFILYAGGKDKYKDKAHLLMDKIIEVIKISQASQPVLILIFFCIRILILRMSADKLTKLFSNSWQLVMFLLINIFKNSKRDKESVNLIWAALKLIQMISIMEISEFHAHQWIFFYDFIGLNFSSQPLDKSKSIQLQYKPLIHQYFPQGIIAYHDKCSKGGSQRHLIIKQDKLDDIQLLRTKALLLSSYMINNNEYKMKFKMEQIEELIENDFLNLDDFIFKFQ